MHDVCILRNIIQQFKGHFMKIATICVIHVVSVLYSYV